MKSILEPTVCDGLELPSDMDNNKDGTSIADICQVVTRSRRRQASTSEDSSALRFRAFRHQSHSLRINVSELAACAGFHPYKCLPQLLFEHVYQGMNGHALLMHDAKLLGLRVVSDQQVWQELAQKASAATQQALDQALRVQSGQNKLASVQAAEALRRQVVKEAKSSKRLTSQQLAMLEDGARHCIHTGFGTTWESHALDLYEKQCGWEITERNAEVRIWEFDAQGNQIGPPRPSSSNISSRGESKSTTQDLLDEQVLCQSDSEQPSTTNSFSLSKRQKIESNSHDKHVLFESTDCSDSQQQNNSNISTKTTDQESLTRDGPTNEDDASFVNVGRLPYFSLRGSVDGIRQELVPIPKQRSHDHTSSDHVGDDDEDEFDTDVSWALRQIIVECKHRMYQIQPIPPIYEMIQATAYCLMYDTKDADLIQVLRTTEGVPKGSHQQSKTSIQEKENKVMNKITNYLVPEKTFTHDDAIKTTVSHGDAIPFRSHDDENCSNKSSPPPIDTLAKSIDDAELYNTTTNSSKKSQDGSLEIGTPGETGPPNQLEISVYRISIDDDLFQHRKNFQNIVLPRLQSWADAVYSVRKDDDKRYRLLLALAEERLQVAWNILLDECPWLRDCDTSYSRDVSK